MVHFLNFYQHLTSESDPGATAGPPSSDIPSSSSFSSRLASLLSRRSCFSISALMRLDSFASSLRQQAIMASKDITTWAEKPSHGKLTGWTKTRCNKLLPPAVLTLLVGVKLLSAIKYVTVHSKDCVIIVLTGNTVAKKINLYASSHETNPVIKFLVQKSTYFWIIT